MAGTPRPSSILITGASGYIGSSIAYRLGRDGHRVTAVGGTRPVPQVVQAVSRSTLHGDLAHYELCDSAQFRGHDVVIHAAALASAGACEHNPALAERCNIDATVNLLRACANPDRPPLFIALSTDLVFDGGRAPEGGFRESDPPVPSSVYARTKLAAEAHVMNARGSRGIVLRIALTYGEKLEHNEGVMGWISRALEERSPLPLFIDEFRSPLYIGDLVDGIMRLVKLRTAASADPDHIQPRHDDLSPDTAARHAESRGEIFHFGGPERVSRLVFGQLFANTHGYSSDSIIATTRAAQPTIPERPEDVSLNSDRLFQTIGFRGRPITEGFAAMRAAKSSHQADGVTR